MVATPSKSSGKYAKYFVMQKGNVERAAAGAKGGYHEGREKRRGWYIEFCVVFYFMAYTERTVRDTLIYGVLTRKKRVGGNFIYHGDSVTRV